MFEVNAKNMMEEEERHRRRTWLGFSLVYLQYSAIQYTTIHYSTIQYKYTTVQNSVQFGSFVYICAVKVDHSRFLAGCEAF